MTIRQCFEACLIELDKVQAPSLLLEDFNYLLNKSIQKYFNKRYALFERNQQLTDDLRVLTRTKKLTKKTTTSAIGSYNTCGDTISFLLPDDYVHILNCICEFNIKNDSKSCSDEEKVLYTGASKLTSNEWSQVITNYYMRPSIKQPYYYIQNIEDPTVITGLTWNNNGTRYGNSQIPQLEIKCGNGNLNCIYIDYLVAPKHLELTQEDLDKIDDDTDALEFPDYVVYEIINELVLTILENQKDPRIQSFGTVNTTIPTPAQR